MCTVGFALLLQLCWESCGGRGRSCLHSHWPLLPPSGTVFPAWSSVVGRCVFMCVSDKGSGRSDEGGKEAFCGPSNWNAPALFSQTWLCTLTRTNVCTHTHKIKSRNLFLVTEREWAVSEQKWVCICQLQQTCKHTHSSLLYLNWDKRKKTTSCQN